MGIWRDFWLGPDAETPLPVVSPYQPDSLSPAVVIAEALQLELSGLPMNRAQAIQIPAVSRARNLIAGAIAPLPLVALNGSGKLSAQPTFLYRSSTLEDPYQRMLWTVDDLIFRGVSLWAVERGAKTNGAAHAPVLDAVRVPLDRWSIRNGRIEVDGKVVDSEEVILFNGPTNGILNDARDSLRAAQAVEAAFVSRARNPLPLTVLEHAPGNTTPLTPEEVTALLEAWKTARKNPDGAVGYLPPGLTLTTPGTDAETLLESARNAGRVDIANHIGIPVSLLDGGIAESSLTYRNAQGEVSRFYGDLEFWMDPIAHRLSQDDVVPRGTRVRFDLSEFTTPAPEVTGVPTED